MAPRGQDESLLTRLKNSGEPSDCSNFQDPLCLKKKVVRILAPTYNVR